MRRLKEWTGAQWVVVVNAVGGAATLRDARYAEVMEHPLVKAALDIFPGAEITAIREAPQRTAEAAPAPAEAGRPDESDSP
jgi:DNA polymerase-3 subunit gamma/tau